MSSISEYHEMTEEISRCPAFVSWYRKQPKRGAGAISRSSAWKAWQVGAEAEREACALVCDSIAHNWRGANSQIVECATAIRLRSNASGKPPQVGLD